MMLFCEICGHQKKIYESFTSASWECTNENCGKTSLILDDGNHIGAPLVIEDCYFRLIGETDEEFEKRIASEKHITDDPVIFTMKDYDDIQKAILEYFKTFARWS